MVDDEESKDTQIFWLTKLSSHLVNLLLGGLCINIAVGSLVDGLCGWEEPGATSLPTIEWPFLVSQGSSWTEEILSWFPSTKKSNISTVQSSDRTETRHFFNSWHIIKHILCSFKPWFCPLIEITMDCYYSFTLRGKIYLERNHCHLESDFNHPSLELVKLSYKRKFKLIKGHLTRARYDHFWYIHLKLWHTPRWVRDPRSCIGEPWIHHVNCLWGQEEELQYENQ